MPMRNDPRIRQTLNQISQNIETANTNTQTALFSFTEYYLKPCFASVSECAGQCTAPCFPDRYDERHRRRAGRHRGRTEFNFDFYDDWDDDAVAADSGGILGWGNDELDRLLAGSGSAGRAGGTVSDQPERKRGMGYGTVTRQSRRRTTLQNRDAEDPTIVPSSSAFGFLERLPWKFGSRGVRYKPSAANLQENPGQSRFGLDESEPLIEDSDEEGGIMNTARRKTGRARSGTAGSGSTTESFRSRGDLFPSEDEDDAVPLDDEFAMALERRTTGSGADESIGVGSGKRPSRSRTVSSKSIASSKRRLREGKESSIASTEEIDVEAETRHSVDVDVPTMQDLKHEEERINALEEAELSRKREAAKKLAEERGLAPETGTNSPKPPPDEDAIDPSIPSQFPNA